MHSIKEIFRIGHGPSSSHTMAPGSAAEIFVSRYPEAAKVEVVLYGSLAATGKGHLTDSALTEALFPREVNIRWQPEVSLPEHPNGMDFSAYDSDGKPLGAMRAFSTGGGALRIAGEASPETDEIYRIGSMQSILEWCSASGSPIWKLVEECEGVEIWEYLGEIWQTMREAIERGLKEDGVLPGSLKLSRKARSFLKKAKHMEEPFARTGRLSAYALAVAEENAGGGIIVTAPTCGSCGVLPAVLRYVDEKTDSSEDDILRALAIAGLVGNLVKQNASISGAEVGCQGEIGTACAMAAAAAAYLQGASPRQIEYAAEMGIEHHLGLTCDPVGGYVQIPCIERNAFAATRALDCADYALLGDGCHRISFDEVTATMKQTGCDLASSYRETSTGGLAAFHKEQ